MNAQESKRCAAGKTRFDIVPPFYLIAFTELPAEQNDPAVTQRGKVHQTTAKVFELHAERFQVADQ